MKKHQRKSGSNEATSQQQAAPADGQTRALVRKSIWKYLEEPGSRREGGEKILYPLRFSA